MEFTAKQLADLLKGAVDGDENVKVSDFAKIEEGAPGKLSFLSNKKYTHYIYTTESSIVLVDEDFVAEQPIKATLIRVKNAYEALATLLKLAADLMPRKTGIHHSAIVSPSAKIGDLVYIGAYAVIGDKCVISDGAMVYPHTCIGDNVTVGESSRIYSNVSIYDNCVIGQRCVIHSGVVIGADGFGFAPDAEGHYNKIPQMGNVILEDDVEIGANTTIDCATMGSTIVKRGTKIDNLCQIAHNVVIGQDTAMAAQSGVAGSAKIGSRCVLAGQVGVVGHITVPDGTILAAQTGVSGNIRRPGAYCGSPAQPIEDFRRNAVIGKRLSDMYDRLMELEKKMKQ
ncbi:MAG: UDP-3-O-(3-hydroxymyristoyl)glucosamine N-acyltransferase [Paludibacteraceae bacterium]|nr:UDP-3-O-(3-hydroxymyristoyl)glucosamine N-acyltransferase [Paludibacteraceae bacterium]